MEGFIYEQKKKDTLQYVRAEAQTIDERMKVKNQIKWVRLMNGICKSAEAVVRKEIIFE